MAEETKTTVVTTDEKPRRYPFFRRYYYTGGPGAGRNLFNFLLTLLLLAGLIALILYLIYRPSKPSFTVASVGIYGLQAGSSAGYPNAISTSMQFTVITRNSNDRGSILYHDLSAYVTYRGQPITPPTRLPPLVQERESAVAVSPVLGGIYVPVSGDVAAGIGVDQGYGVLALRFVMLGRVKYKTGPFHSAWTGLYVGCDVLVGVRRGVNGQVPLIGEPQCSVDA